MSSPAPDSVCRYGPHDEALHDAAAQPLYNESVYVNFVAGVAGVAGVGNIAGVAGGPGSAPLGGILRIGLRPTDGYAELSLNLPLAGGATVFAYEREPLGAAAFRPGSPVWRCAGMELEAVEPLRRWRLRFEGSSPRRLLDAAAFGADPGAALRGSRACRVALALEFEARRPIHALSESGDIVAAGGVPFARDHYEQFGQVGGVIELDGVRWQVAGGGFRDHSWGPRDWQSAPHSNFTTLLGEDGSATVAFAARLDGRDHVQGVRWDESGLERLTGFELRSEYDGGFEIGERLTVAFRRPAGEVRYDGRVRAFLPLRHRGGGRTVRIAQVLVDFDGPAGAARGWSDLTRPAS